jgi:cyclic pyranopterin phosphate synthase
MPQEGIPNFGHTEILRYEEIVRLAGMAAKRGISKIRITGGEPLVRRDVVHLVRHLAGIQGILDLSMTTNGVLLEEFAQELKQGGLHRINISMDSLNPEKYGRITRGGNLDRVWSGIEAARRAGLAPIKINVVAIAGFNDDEILDFAKLTLRDSLQVRFIEFMPIGASNGWQPEQCIPSSEIKKRLESFSPLIPLGNGKNTHDGPARLFKIPGAAGTIGLISPVSDHFCTSCNRQRLTADGKLKTCLFSEEEVDLKILLRSDYGDDVIEKALSDAISRKPFRHGTIIASLKRCQRPMVKIGG